MSRLTNHVKEKEKVKSTISADSYVAAQADMGLQREIRIALTEKKQQLYNSLQTTKLKRMSC